MGPQLGAHGKTEHQGESCMTKQRSEDHRQSCICAGKQMHMHAHTFTLAPTTQINQEKGENKDKTEDL